MKKYILFAVLLLHASLVLGQRLCTTLEKDSTLAKVKAILRCEPFISRGSYQGGVGQCWYSWEVGGKSLLEDYLVLNKPVRNVIWKYSTNGSPDDTLLNGVIYIYMKRGRDYVSVKFINGYITGIWHQAKNAFVEYDYEILVSCRIAVVRETVGDYAEWFSIDRSGWDVSDNVIFHLSDGSIARRKGMYTKANR
ncbi:MAG TPA: hypothetical protein PL070_17810 [Flavobacteriales bacterium]|nr:hypothetical protein [Flavobacteriales bacterium]